MTGNMSRPTRKGFEKLSAHLCALHAGSDGARLRHRGRAHPRARPRLCAGGAGDDLLGDGRTSQHTHGTDNARCLILARPDDRPFGRPGTGLHPLRGQNNVQGASDAGLIPMVLPDYAKVSDPATRERFEALWGFAIDPQPGLTVVEIIEAIHREEIRAMYIMGENPAMSDPDVAHAREALAALDYLVVQDIFLTETAMFADIILPASAWPEKTGTVTNTNRQVQMGRPALPPPGDAREDLAIIIDLARHLGLGWDYTHPREVFAEMAQVMPSMANISWERLEREDAVTYPCPAPDQPGSAIVFGDGFPREGGRGLFVPADVTDPAELPDEAFPLVLTTGRQLEHWHTGAMTRRASVLDAIEPGPSASLHPDTLAQLGIAPGETIRVETRRGTISLPAQRRISRLHVPDGVSCPFASFRRSAANNA